MTSFIHSLSLAYAMAYVKTVQCLQRQSENNVILKKRRATMGREETDDPGSLQL